jgi:hypothetical protein
MYSQDSRSNSQHHVDASSEEAPVWPFYSTYYHQQEAACPAYDESEPATVLCSQPSSFNWEVGVERPLLTRVTEQQPASSVVTTLVSLEDHINQVCAYEQSETPATARRPEEQPSTEVYDFGSHGARPSYTVLAGPSMRSFLKVLYVYLERADPKMLRDVKQTINVCCIQKQLKVPQFASLAEALERELKPIVGERYWKRIQMYHREICKNLQKRRV